MTAYATASGTIVVHVGQATKLELAERASVEQLAESLMEAVPDE